MSMEEEILFERLKGSVPLTPEMLDYVLTGRFISKQYKNDLIFIYKDELIKMRAAHKKYCFLFCSETSTDPMLHSNVSDNGSYYVKWIRYIK